MAAPTKAMAGLSLNTQGTLKPHSSFNPEQDGENLKKAMKGFGTDEKAIIDILGHRTNEQRQKILLMYKTMFGKDLVKDLKGELSGHFEDVIVALMEKPADYDANQLHKAMKGAGTDEQTLIEIMCTRRNAEIHAIRDAFKKLHKADLEKHLSSETSGHFQRLMVSMSTGGRMEGQAVDHAKAKVDADQLYKAGEGQWGTDESKFNMILASQSFEQLRAVFDEYNKISKKTIESAIKSEMSGDLETGMLTIVKIARNTPAYFAERLYKSMKGLGTDDTNLIRIIVTRCEVDMVQIKQEFHKNYNKTLEEFIKGDVSGDYKRILLSLVGGH